MRSSVRRKPDLSLWVIAAVLLLLAASSLLARPTFPAQPVRRAAPVGPKALLVYDLWGHRLMIDTRSITAMREGDGYTAIYVGREMYYVGLEYGALTAKWAGWRGFGVENMEAQTRPEGLE